MNYKWGGGLEAVPFADVGEVCVGCGDVVYSPQLPLRIRDFPKGVRFLFGPHLSVFPDDEMLLDIFDGVDGDDAVVWYIQPSEWACNVWRSLISPKFVDKVRFAVCPFGVDVARFCPLELRGGGSGVFLYIKNRSDVEVASVIAMCAGVGVIIGRIFTYGHYSESDYLAFLQNEAKFGIWMGAHESQGFALLEALSCNVPLLVWSVRSMSQEWGMNNPDLEATTVPYWNPMCGEVVYDGAGFSAGLERVLVGVYSPRQYILDNLTDSKCEERFIGVIRKMME